jgi:hypothetical protein
MYTAGELVVPPSGSGAQYRRAFAASPGWRVPITEVPASVSTEYCLKQIL